MSLSRYIHGTQQTRDSIGSHPDILGIPKISRENLAVFEEPVIIFDRDIDNSWIVGSSTNAIVGTWTGTAGGGQLVVGPTDNTKELLQVVLPNNTWVNFLRDTAVNTEEPEGALISNTGTFDLDEHELELDENEAVTWHLVKGTQVPIRKVGVLISEERVDGFDDIVVEVSHNGTDWQELINETETLLNIPSPNLIVRIRSEADGVVIRTSDANGFERPILFTVIT